MLDSVKISRRQSSIRGELAKLIGKEKPDETETRAIADLDSEYQTNEVRYSASLISEDEQREEAKGELETRSDKEYSELVGKFEMRQIALALDEGRALDGATNEVVTELRSQGGFRGLPVPWESLEIRAGETIASGTPDPIRTMPIIDRLFAQSAAARMGCRMINIPVGEVEYPVTSSSLSAAWAATETGDVAAAAAYATLDRPLAPDNTLGIQMKLTRKSLKQSGSALEQAVRRDMNGAIGEALDTAIFQGSGASGEPTGVFTGATAWSITETAIDAAATWAAFRAAVVRFMTGNAAASPADVMLMLRPEIWDGMDGTLITSTAVSEWDRMLKNIPAKNIVLSSNALAAPTGTPAESKGLLTTSAGGVPPIYCGLWGAIDLIRDPFSDAASGGLRLTGLVTADVTISRAAQLEVLLQVE